MSIELYQKITTLEERVAALEGLVAQLGPPYIPLVSAPARKRPGPPKGYKRQPKQAQPNG
jgi:hypothetical protein